MITKEQHQRNVDFIANLRAGCWRQVKGWLRTAKGYCAEGAACDFSCLGEWNENSGRFHYVIDGIYTSVRLPWQVREFFGWPKFFCVDGFDPFGLSDLNDSSDGGLKGIADVLEQWLNAQAVAS